MLISWSNFLFFVTFQVKLNANKMDLTIPHQAFIDNEFVDSSSGQTFNTINPNNEEVFVSLLYFTRLFQ